MKLNSLKGKLSSKIELSHQFMDDPYQSVIYIWGPEQSGTTSLAQSIVEAEEALEGDKKVYILMTEPPHNITGPMVRFYEEAMKSGKFVIPTNDGKPFPITKKSDFVSFLELMKSQDDVGVIIVDAVDTLAKIFAESTGTDFAMKAYGDAYSQIDSLVKTILGLQILPTIFIMKQKNKYVKELDKRGREMPKKTDEIIPRITSEQVLRWASIRLRTTEKGKYTVLKGKGNVEDGEKFEFGISKLKKRERTGTWLPELLEMMKFG